MSDPGISAAYVDSSTFTVTGNRTLEFVDYRRVKANCGSDGYKYSSVVVSSYDSEEDKTTVYLYDECLTPGLTEVWYGAVSPGDQGSFPERFLKYVTRRQVLIYG